MHTVKLQIEDNIYTNVMFLLTNLKLKGLEIEEEPKKDLTTKQKVKDHFKMQKINIFKDIKDPLKWQKEQREEW